MKENQNFDINFDIFNDLSDNNLLQKSKRVLKESKLKNIFDIVNSEKKGRHYLAEHFQTLSVRVKLSPNQDLQVKRSQNQDGL